MTDVPLQAPLLTSTESLKAPSQTGVGSDQPLQVPSPQSDSVHFNWKMGGRAGEGIMTTASTLAYAAHRHGLKTFTYFEYPSLIKGGHQTGQVYADFEHASCQKRALDILIALDEEALKQHQAEITQDTIIIAEPNIDKYDITQYQHLTKHIFSVQMTTISRETTGTSIATNTVSLGISAYFLGLDKEVFFDMIRQQFQHKGEEIVTNNIKAFEAGYAQAQTLRQPLFHITKKPLDMNLLTASEAMGIGAIAGGLQFYAAYPMSPSSNVFHFVAGQQENFPLVVRHAEDEIAAINLVIGASYGGVRAMTGSAGGGFALMVEALSLIGVTELPMVILVAQRPGPATGLPTWTGQGDLQFVLHAGHGEFQRIILAPGDTEQHFEFTRRAFDIAEKYQVPVILLTDKYLLEAYQTMPTPQGEYQLNRLSMATAEDLKEDNSYRRYRITDSGISPRSIPGQAHGVQLTNSYEHDEFGYATEDAQMTISQVEKRDRKLKNIQAELPQPYIIGPDNADITFVGWGSTLSVFQQLIHEQSSKSLNSLSTGETVEATVGAPTREGEHAGVSSVDQKHPTVNYLHLPTPWPFPSDKFMELVGKTKKLVMIEGNYTGQMEQLIRQETGLRFEHRYRRYDGRPFYVEDILTFVNSNDKIPNSNREV